MFFQLGIILSSCPRSLWSPAPVGDKGRSGLDKIVAHPILGMDVYMEGNVGRGDEWMHGGK